MIISGMVDLTKNILNQKKKVYTLTNLTKTYYVKRYAYMTKIRNKCNQVLHLTHYTTWGVFLSEHRTSRSNVCDVYCTNVTVRQNERKKAFGRSPPYQEY